MWEENNLNSTARCSNVIDLEVNSPAIQASEVITMQIIFGTIPTSVTTSVATVFAVPKVALI